ncbi:MAG: hypothetical protein KGZ68_12180 [Dechloromonas sp.]|nr:hypothetical protein [Dechloromonas sp.]
MPAPFDRWPNRAVLEGIGLDEEYRCAAHDLAPSAAGDMCEQASLNVVVDNVTDQRCVPANGTRIARERRFLATANATLRLPEAGHPMPEEFGGLVRLCDPRRPTRPKHAGQSRKPAL